ncbi:MAG: LptF/LptG family permease [Capsulimonadaceae bacterium]|nr:LptF/LptG family permease [Capsulimonadaceae bacterium]
MTDVPVTAKRPGKTGLGRTLDRFLFAEIVPQVLLYLLIVGGMFLLFTATVVMQKFLASGVSIWIIVEVLLLNLPPYIVIAFPMAMLLGAILGFTKISTDSEAVALLAAGVSFRRMLLPAAIVGAVLMVAGMIINNTLAPFAAARLADISANVLKDTSTSSKPFLLPPLRTNVNGVSKLQATVWVEGGYDATEKALRQVYITRVDPVTGMPAMEIFAATANWQGGESWILKDVNVLRGGAYGHWAYFNTTEIKETPTSMTFLQRPPEAMNFSDLRRKVQILKQIGGAAPSDIREAEVTLWNKIWLPVASFVFAFVGAALGFRPQRSASRGMAIGFGVFIIFCYYAMFKGMEVVATNGMIAPSLAVSLPVICATALGVILVARTTT